MNLYQVLFTPGLIEKYQYLFEDLAEVRTLDSGEKVAHMTCTQVDTSGNYLDLTVSEIPNGEPRRVLLGHSFVVAILEITSHKTQLGFLGQEEIP